MVHSAMVRIARFLFAVAFAISPAATELAHSEAHHRVSHQHHSETHSEAAVENSVFTAVELDAADHDSDHSDPDLGPGVSPRPDSAHLVDPSELSAVVQPRLIEIIPDASSETEATSGISPCESPPPEPRGPPVG